jgi:hypothetical protein
MGAGDIRLFTQTRVSCTCKHKYCAIRCVDYNSYYVTRKLCCDSKLCAIHTTPFTSATPDVADQLELNGRLQGT